MTVRGGSFICGSLTKYLTACRGAVEVAVGFELWEVAETAFRGRNFPPGPSGRVGPG